MSTCSQSEYARRHGVSRAAVSTWAKQGRIVLSAGQVDIELSDVRLSKHRDTSRPINRKAPAEPLTPEAEKFFAGFTPITPIRQDGVYDHGPGIQAGYDARMAAGETIADAAGRLAEAHADESFDKSKARKERYAGLLNQLEYDQKSGLVVAVADVAAIVGAQLATVRTKLIAIPSEHAPRIARLKTATEVQDALLEVIVEALSELTADAA